MKKSNLWLFGDSFVSQKIGWIRELANVKNLDIVYYGTPGGSTGRMLYELNNSMQYIKPEDRVIICYTSIYRHFINGKDFGASLINLEDLAPVEKKGSKLYSLLDIATYTQEDIEFVQRGVNYLFTSDLLEQVYLLQKTIHHNIVKSLPTEHVVELFGFNNNSEKTHNTSSALNFKGLDFNYDFNKYPYLMDFIQDNGFDYNVSPIHISSHATAKFFQVYGDLFKNF